MILNTTGGKPKGEWPYYIYYHGNEFTALTGGWRTAIGTTTVSAPGTATKNADNLELTILGDVTRANSWITTNKIDITSYNYIGLYNTEWNSVAPNFNFAIAATNTNTIDTNWQNGTWKMAVITGAKRHFLVDVSDLSGNFYVFISGATKVGGTLHIKIPEIYLL